jgi:hypothetical protein
MASGRACPVAHLFEASGNSAYAASQKLAPQGIGFNSLGFK